MLWFIVLEIACSSRAPANEDFSALNKPTCESFFKITPGNDKINFAVRAYRDSFAISLLLKYTLIHYLLFRNLKSFARAYHGGRKRLTSCDNSPFN